jgi:hypothetical protein
MILGKRKERILEIERERHSSLYRQCIGARGFILDS